MPEILPKNPGKPSLLMVSDTSMLALDGQKHALGPVVRELNALLPLFNRVTWIGFDKPEYRNDRSFTPVDTSKIRLIFLPKCGGDRWVDKLGVLLRTPGMFWRIFREILRHEIVYTRAPSAPAFIATLLSVFFPNKVFWHKYAGNWVQNPAPRFFAFQRSLLKKALNAKVTINGKWPDQPAHCLSFENPCLEETALQKGRECLAQKSFSDPIQFCFVGRLEAAKGVNWIINAFENLQDNPRIGALHLVGDGPLREACQQLAQKSTISVQLHGFLDQEKVSEIMAQSHILLLPSAAEGFPKVVAEAANLGCIPMVSEVSCIGQYIEHQRNGFLLQPDLLPTGELEAQIRALPNAEKLAQMAEKVQAICPFFTYDYFVRRVQQDILRPR